MLNSKEWCTDVQQMCPHVLYNTCAMLCCVCYRDGPSQLLPQPNDNIWELDTDSMLPVAEALQLLVQMVPGASSIRPGVNCGGRFPAAASPEVPTGGELTCWLCGCAVWMCVVVRSAG